MIEWKRSFAWLFLLSVILSGGARAAESIGSPDGNIRVDLSLDKGELRYQVFYLRAPILGLSALGPVFDPPLEGGLSVKESRRWSVTENWKPVWGERETIWNVYHGILVTLRENGTSGRVFQVEIRVFNEGVALRYVFPESKRPAGKIIGEQTEFQFAETAAVWPIFSTEGTFPKAPVFLKDIAEPVFAPMTLQVPKGPLVALLEAAGDHYPRLKFVRRAPGIVAVELMDAADCAAPFTSPWRVMMIAPNEKRLVENESFLLNLTAPCAIPDTAWIQPGKTLSNESNCAIKTDELKSMVDFAAQNGMKYVQIDWGWYGTEWPWSESEQAKWAETNPDRANDPTWRGNTIADPYRVAKGLVPYLPDWKSATEVDLDLPELIRYGKEKGVGICLYVNDRVLKANDLDQLFGTYEKWGLAGLKPGFVRYGSQRDTGDLRRMIQTAAAHRLWLCIHDAHLPDASFRTFPNEMSVEGGGGQEGNHPAEHDVTLPFTRGLAGPFDYTPMLYQNGKSHAHQLSLLITLYTPAPVIRGGWRIRDAAAEGGYGDVFGSEIEFLRSVETDWADTKVLEAAIGKYIIIGRKTKSGNWQLGGTNGPTATRVSLDLGFLSPGVDYTMKLWTDAQEEKEGWRPTERIEKTVRRGDRVEFIMQPAGGAVALFEKLP